MEFRKDLGPTLWNVFYDQVITSINEQDVKVVAYADDLALVIKGRNSAILEDNTIYALLQVRNKLRDIGLTLAKHKTEATIIRGWQRCKELQFRFEDTDIKLSTSLKYMGVYIDSNWKFHTHVENIKKKSQSMLSCLSRLTSNINGPTAAKKRVLVSTVHSAVLYGAPIW